MDHGLQPRRAALFCVALSGSIFFVPAVLLPLVGAGELGNQRVSLLLTGVGQLWKQNMHWLPFVVLFCGAVLPLALLLAQLAIYGPESWTRKWLERKDAVQAARFLGVWAIPEVQVLAVIVGVIKLHGIVHLQIGPGFWCYCAMAACLLVGRSGIEAEVLEEGHHAVPLIPKSRSNCAAFALAAIVLLGPANLIPVLATETEGDNRIDTIYSGAMELGHQGQWGLAAIVFTASILIPAVKLIGIACLLFRPAHPGHRHGRMLEKLYAFLARIGRWSMLDVFLAGFLVGLVEFGEFATVQARDGLIAFALVVVLTLLATESYDPGEIWSGRAAPLSA